jgi:hypothetical protein
LGVCFKIVQRENKMNERKKNNPEGVEVTESRWNGTRLEIR